MSKSTSFSPDKLRQFQSAKELQSPIKLTNVKITPNRGKDEITVNNRTILNVCKQLHFTLKPPAPNPSTQTIPLAELNPNMLVRTKSLCLLKLHTSKVE